MTDDYTVALKRLKELGEAMAQCAQAFMITASKAAEELMKFGSAMDAIIWNQYIMAGAPYGETLEGMLRWLQESSDE